MGNIARISCPECGYGASLYLGAGMADCDLESSITRFDERIVTKIHEWIDSHDFIRHNTDIVMAFCETCGLYVSTPTITLYTISGESCMFRDNCKNCGNETVDGRSTCAICGSDLRQDITGWWD